MNKGVWINLWIGEGMCVCTTTGVVQVLGYIWF